MLNKLIYFLIVTLSFKLITLNAAEPQPVSVSKELQPAFNLIMQVPEARQVVAEIQKEGSFRIIANHHQLSQTFGAYWDYENRSICVNVAHHDSQGEIIGSILFEMHNALTTKSYDRLDNLAQSGRIDRESYIRGVEHQEFENSLNTAKLAKIGIRMGLFPQDACLPTYNSFEEHYRMQQYGGHSAWIGRAYDELAPR